VGRNSRCVMPAFELLDSPKAPLPTRQKCLSHHPARRVGSGWRRMTASTGLKDAIQEAKVAGST